MKTFRLSAVYGAPPIFNADIDEMGYVEPADLGLSPNLIAELDKWNITFQKTFSEEYPPDSGFKSTSERERHNAQGAALALVLQNELGRDSMVQFVPLS